MLLHLGVAILCAGLVQGLGQKQCVTFEKPEPLHRRQQALFESRKSDHFVIVSTENNFVAPILLDSSDDSAVHIAAQTFADDIERVSGTRPELYNDTLPAGSEETAIIIGTYSSHLLAENNGQLEDLKGKWESFDIRVRDRPAPGVKHGLIITGSDRVSPLREFDLTTAWNHFRDLRSFRAARRFSVVLLGRCSHSAPRLCRFPIERSVRPWRANR